MVNNPYANDSDELEPYDWKDKDYFNLPENVQHAIDVAFSKNKHSPFFYKLQGLNDKLYVY